MPRGVVYSVRRRWWILRIRFAMERWYRAKKSAVRRFERVDRLVWRYDTLFGEDKP